MTFLNPGLDPTEALVQTRRIRSKYGYLNFEQAVTDDDGLFGRWSWNNGKDEIAAFTDIDASLSLGPRSGARAGDDPRTRSAWPEQSTACRTITATTSQQAASVS